MTHTRPTPAGFILAPEFCLLGGTISNRMPKIFRKSRFSGKSLGSADPPEICAMFTSSRAKGSVCQTPGAIRIPTVPSHAKARSCRSLGSARQVISSVGGPTAKTHGFPPSGTQVEPISRLRRMTEKRSASPPNRRRDSTTDCFIAGAHHRSVPGWRIWPKPENSARSSGSATKRTVRTFNIASRGK